jgi:hypothetical protein
VTGPGSSTDEAIARFDSTSGKVLQNSNVTISDTGAFTFPDGVKQTFNPDGTNAGINVGSQAGDPSSLANGDVWYDSTNNTLDARVNGSTVTIGAASSGAMTKIEEQTPSGVTSVTFSSLGSYTHLKIMWTARTDNATTITDLNIKFNGDTGNNYDREEIRGSTTTASASESVAQASITVGVVSGTSSASNLIGSGEIDVLDYRGTTFHKTALANSHGKAGNSSGSILTRVTGVSWRDTSAITSITLTLGIGNFVSGSKFSLYGIQ